MENGDLRNVKESLSRGEVDLSRVYEDKELICGEDWIRVRIEILHTVLRMGFVGAPVDVDTCCSVEKRN